MQKEHVTKTFEETRSLGAELAKTLRGGEVIALHGDLGAGKTTFMQGFAHGLSIKKNVISPTFIIMRSYKLSSLSDPSKGLRQAQAKNLYHLDLYRIETEAEAIDLGVTDLMGQPENIVAIEWPEKIENLLPEKTIHIYFEYIEENKRSIRIDR
jgi:tRNA threonylcarbamoyladenosine biosynthesis protein TsaE